MYFTKTPIFCPWATFFPIRCPTLKLPTSSNSAKISAIWRDFRKPLIAHTCQEASRAEQKNGNVSVSSHSCDPVPDGGQGRLGEGRSVKIGIFRWQWVGKITPLAIWQWVSKDTPLPICLRWYDFNFCKIGNKYKQLKIRILKQFEQNSRLLIHCFILLY